MTRLIKHANHVSTEMHIEVTDCVKDGDRTKRRQSSDSYLTARKLVMENIITPTNENMLKIMNYIDSGKYQDIGCYKDNIDSWNKRTIELMRNDKIIISKRNASKFLKKLSYHDMDDRRCAIIFIDGEFIESESHNQALTEYMDSYGIARKKDGDSQQRVNMEDDLEELENVSFACLNLVDGDLFEYIFENDYTDFDKLSEDGFESAGDLPDNFIFIEENTIKNISLNELISEIKSIYGSDVPIYIDDYTVSPDELDQYDRIANKRGFRRL